MSREPLVLLVHRIPYPPNKGDKIRSFHLLRHLAERYRVHLGAFVDDPADWAHAGALSELCAEVRLVPLRPRAARLRALGGLATGAPLTLPYYRSGAMRRWLRRTLRATGTRRLVAFSAAMAQYADEAAPGCTRVLDLVDVDSDKWRQYGQRRRGPAGWVYRREARRLLAYERRCAAAFDHTVLVSPAEAALFLRLAPEAAGRVRVAGNGVDTDYFAPRPDLPDPYPAGAEPLVFTGAMDYWANADAVSWFAEAVLPRVRARHPQAAFYVVGTRPGEAVQRLARLPGVRVTGGVPDIRPYLAHARLAVAPMRVARGIQNKVLEAFAMAKPVLATGAALDGLGLDAAYPLAADSADEMARLAGEALGSGGSELGAEMRRWVTRRFRWDRQLAAFGELLEGPAAAPEAAAVAEGWRVGGCP
ncbi:MAG TPA: TIGR03087 family PEP-CTERM/XrtA system glycosyltransferase [Gammaproteobacteria bacterium]|nr:TIGR03087 family PEP-CTERM/XrtA system glycosyltransferase [Gammaproteobacteria bacterium]